jgi:nicotinamide-nucleotide amidase
MSLYTNLLTLAKKLRVGINTIESITAGAIGAHFVAKTPGSSEVFREGLCVYCNESKLKRGLDPDILKRHGSISLETTRALALLCPYERSITIATTGQASLPLDLKEPPEGTVFYAVAFEGRVLKEGRLYFEGDREEIINQAVEAVLKECETCLREMATTL